MASQALWIFCRLVDQLIVRVENASMFWLSSLLHQKDIQRYMFTN